MRRILLEASVLAFSLAFSASPLAAQAPTAAKPQPPEAYQHVSPNGKNSNDGLSWSTAKATVDGARAALPSSGGDLLLAPLITATPPPYTSFNSFQLLNFTNLNGTEFKMTPRATGQWFLNREIRTVSGNPTVSGRISPHHYPMVVGKTISLNSGRSPGDLSSVEELQDLVLTVSDFAPNFSGTLWGEEIDSDISVSSTIDHIVGLGVFIGPYSDTGNAADLDASTNNASTGISSTCENNGRGFFALCKAFTASAQQNGTSSARWGGLWGFVGTSPAAGNGETFNGNNYNFVSYAPASLPKFSSTNYHDFGMVLTTNSGSQDPFTNDIWFWGGGWNSGHFLFGSSQAGDHVWWAGGRYGWATKEGGAPASSADFTYSTAMIDSRTNTLVMPRGSMGDPSITADGPLTLDPEELNLSPHNHAVVIGDDSHLQQSTANGDLAGRMTLASGSGSHTFAHPFTSPPVCVAADTTAVNAVKVTTSTTSLTVVGTSGDVVNYICMGNPN